MGGRPGLFADLPGAIGEQSGGCPGGRQNSLVGDGIAGARQHDISAGQLCGDRLGRFGRPDERNDGSIRRRSAQRGDLGRPNHSDGVGVGALSEEFVHGFTPLGLT